MTVTVEIFGELKRSFGWKKNILEIEDGWTIGDLLFFIVRGTGTEGNTGLIINRNGKRSNLETRLLNGDEIQLVKPMIGG